VLGQDIYALGYISKIIKVKEFKTFRKDKLIQNSYSMKVKNFDNFFSVDNTHSLLNGQEWQFSPVQIYDGDNELIWDGIIEDVIRDHKRKTATIITQNSMVKFMRTKIEYESGDWETPAEASRNILDAYGFTNYNSASFTGSDNKLIDEGCYIKCHFEKGDDITLQSAIEKLGEYGCADVYSHLGEIFFDVYREFTGGVKTSIGLDEADAPVVKGLLRDIINEYRIRYTDDAGTPATDANSNNIGARSRAKFGVRSLPEMGGTSEDQIEIKDKTSATYIGECYINQSHANLSTGNVRALWQIDFTLPLTHRGWIDLNTFFRFTLPDEEWNEKLFEIYTFDKDYDRQQMKITAIERIE